MVSLSDKERERLDEALWGGCIYDDVPLVVAQIVADHVAAALEDAAERIVEFHWADSYHADEVLAPGYYSAIERACLLLRGQINNWRDRKPQIHN